MKKLILGLTLAAIAVVVLALLAFNVIPMPGSSPNESANAPATSALPSPPDAPVLEPAQGQPAAPIVPPDSPVSAPSPVATSPAPQVTKPAGLSPDWSTASREYTPNEAALNKLVPTPIMVNVRCGTHTQEGGYDRTVFDFNGLMPGYKIEYVQQVIQDGSGNTTNPPGGKYFLNVTFTPADAHYTDGTSALKSKECSATPNFPALRSHNVHSDYEAHVGAALGLGHKAPIRVGAVDKTGPDGKPRQSLYIDVHH